jgi:hypothetical protein
MGYAVGALAALAPARLVHGGWPTLAADGPPLDPSSPQARDWLATELSKQKYHTGATPWERFMDWLRNLLSGGNGTGGGLPAWGTYLAIGVLLLVVALVVVRVVRREARTRTEPGGAVLDEPRVSAEEYRRRAAVAVDRDDWDTVVLEAYRAIARGVVDRTILDDLPGRTADEVARDLGPAFPDAADELRRSAATFDAVRYGHLAATEPAARDVLAAEDRIRRARPILPGLTDVSTGGPP